jgi:hypothetical protein
LYGFLIVFFFKFFSIIVEQFFQRIQQQPIVEQPIVEQQQ